MSAGSGESHGYGRHLPYLRGLVVHCLAILDMANRGRFQRRFSSDLTRAGELVIFHNI